METKTLEKFTKNVSFAHLYFDKLKLTELQNFKDIFKTYKEFDLKNNSFDDNGYEIIFIEIDHLSKQNFKILNDTIGKHIDKNILVFATDYKNSVLSKFLIYSSIEQALPLNNNKKEIEKIFSNFLAKFIEKQNAKQQLEISKKINNLFSFLLFKKNRLIFANKNAENFFGLDELSLIQKRVNNMKDLKIILDSNRDNSMDYKKDYTFYVNNIPKTDEKIVTIIQDKNKTRKSSNSTTDRLQFIEILKDEIAQNSIEKRPLILYFFNINNYDKLKSIDKKLEIYDLIKRILDILLQKKEPEEKLVYWDKHFFILCSKEKDFELAKSAIERLHEILVHLNYEKNFLPSITSSALDLGPLELNEAISCIEDINLGSFHAEKHGLKNFYELSNLNAYLSESEQIKYLLSNYLNSKSTIKLLNIYKGLCINTQSKILKIQDSSYFVSCESLQAYSMRFEKKTVIQAPGLPKDIQAYISYINMEKSYAILDNLTFLETSANNRQYTRVQPRIRMPITVKHKKSVIQGEVLDISTKAIAIILNQIAKDEYLHKTVTLIFRLPNSSSEDGFDLMDIEAKIVNMSETLESKSKLVAMFDLKQPYDSYLLKYMYDRQKELIIELKRASKL